MPFPVAGDTPFTEPIRRLFNTLSQSTEFRSFVGAANESEAHDRLHIFETPYPADPDSDTLSAQEWIDLHPFCILHPPEDGEFFVFDQIATGRAFSKGLAFRLDFHRFVDDPNKSNAQLMLEMMDDVGKIYEEIRQQQPHFDDYFSFTSARFDQPVHRIAHRDRQGLGDVQGWSFVLEYSERDDG